MATRASEARDFFKKIQENEKYENSYNKHNIEKAFINKEKGGLEQNDYNKLF